MEPHVERSIAPSPPPLINRAATPTPSSLSSALSSALSLHSAVPSTIIEDESKNKGEKDAELGRAISVAESAQPPPVKVSRVKRRGLFARFTILAEVEEPKHYARGTKWFITFIIALAAVAAPLGSAIILREHQIIDIDGAGR